MKSLREGVMMRLSGGNPRQPTAPFVDLNATGPDKMMLFVQPAELRGPDEARAYVKVLANLVEDAIEQLEEMGAL